MNSTRRLALQLMLSTLAPMTFAQTAPSAAPASLAGRWEFLFDTEGGPRTFQAELTLDGTNVGGTWDKKTPIKGTFTDGKLDLEFPTTSDEAGDGTLKMTGKLSETLTGSWSFQNYSGTFKATRLKS